ncbi:hypothetical protein GCM10027048_02020 [Hymenobacter coalescens]
MKYLYSLLLAGTVGICPSLAQTTPLVDAAARPHTLEAGIGIAGGDYAYFRTHLGYAHRLGRHLSVGARVAMISASDAVYMAPNVSIPSTYQAINLENEVYLAPFGNDGRFVFALGGGGYVGYSRHHSYLWASYQPNPSGQGYTLETQSRDERGLHVGYIASLNGDLAINPERTWLIGGKIALQNDTYANVMTSLQFKLSRRL